MPQIAALPMYDLPELRDATDALWAAIATRLHEQGIEAPKTLLRQENLEKLWTSPNLLLAQTCGYPLVTSLRGKVTLLATPAYSAPGCEGAFYRSAIIVRADDPARSLADLRGRRCAINDSMSNSGMNLLRAEIAAVAQGNAPFFAETILTGAHIASVAAIADGRADVAAIDCVTWAHLRHLRPAATENLKILGWTEKSPGLPLITALHTPLATQRALTAALADIARDPSLEIVRHALRLEDFVVLDLSAYDAILGAERLARAGGYEFLK